MSLSQFTREQEQQRDLSREPRKQDCCPKCRTPGKPLAWSSVWKCAVCSECARREMEGNGGYRGCT